jgi:hypothetical protein
MLLTASPLLNRGNPSAARIALAYCPIHEGPCTVNEQGVQIPTAPFADASEDCPTATALLLGH